MTSVRSVSFAVLLSGSLAVSGSALAANAVSLSDGVMLSTPVYTTKDTPLAPSSQPPVQASLPAAPVVSQPSVQVQTPPQVQAPAVALAPTVVMGVPVLAGAEKDAFARQPSAPAPAAVVVPASASQAAVVEPVRQSSPPALDASVQLMASAPEPAPEPAPVPVDVPVALPSAAVAPAAGADSKAPQASEAARRSRLTLAATVKAITPSNYRIEYAPDVQKDLIVDAPEAGQPWSMQLDTLARAHGLRVEAVRGVVLVSVAQAGMAPPDTSAPTVPMTLAPVQPPVPVPATPKAVIAPVPPPAVTEAQIKLEAAPVPPPAPSVPVAAPATEKPVAATVLWRAARGQTLMEVLQAWSDQAGVQLYWDSKYDYPLQASLALSGSFEDAVRVILEGFDGASPQPVGKLHRQGNAGARVLIIQSRGNIYGMR